MGRTDIREALRRAGADTRTGLKLGPIFEDSGLPAPEMTLGARVECGPAAGSYQQITEVVRSLLPLIARTGVATPESIDIDTLADRLRQQALERRATLVTPALIGAWARTPEPAGA